MSTYAIETMGCQMNERDSETIAGLLEQMGYNGANGYKDADVIVVNTCSVRENADNRFFGLLGHIKHVKTERPDSIVAVCGCMMQQEHITQQIKDKHAWVDLVFGTHNISALPEMIEGVLAKRRPLKAGPVVSVLPGRVSLAEGLPVRRRFPFKASVNIMYGCNNFCTYCIVPYTRGREISRDAQDILAEVREAAGAGAKEILLLGQNVNSYSGKSGAETVDFADLIAMVDDVPGALRIRFMTSHPKDLSDKLIGMFKPAGEGGAAHLCPSIHLPVQAGSSRVLERMNRRYTKEEYIVLAEKLRAARPDIVITTDLIVGFPGETDEDFEDTMDIIERVRFDSAFTFLYSPRKGTPAAGYGDTVPETVMRERFGRMVARLNAITLEKNRAFVGTVQEVLVEGPSKTNAAMLSGRTPHGKLVSFPAPAGPGSAGALIGETIPVRITSVNTFSFSGELAAG
ncbi:MAG: tRNA (N6-isopentenyl adenosine(37)-C2)-methylthiotransferase MiaB [Clostridiales bacterium]|nr:tRNA (N6-isopentenyl adenosine(37)-C2)-methylthiotransferase MiaB [Clostridiales bacterium]